MAKNKSARKKAATYQQRIILFVDFLGFKAHVNRTVSDLEFLGKLVRAMDRIGKIGEDDRKFQKSQRVTQFSDCVVVSYLVDEESAVFWLLNEIAYCVIDLAERGFLIRGALTVGSLLHTKQHIVGPAMVKAYELESQVAKYPRILIDKQVLKAAAKARNEMHSGKEEANYVKDFMTEDDDGSFYFDYVSWNSVVHIAGGNNDGYPAYLQGIADMIKDGLESTSAGVLEKYLWLHSKYLSELNHFKSLPVNHPYYIENPEFPEFFGEMDTMEAAAEKARSVIDKVAK